MDKTLDKMTVEELLELILDAPHNTMRIMAKNEIIRREKNFRKAIKEGLAKIDSDERLSYPTATVIENAPLALVQCGLENQRTALRWVLKVMDGEGEND